MEVWRQQLRYAGAMIERLSQALKAIADERLAPYLGARCGFAVDRKAGGEVVTELDQAIEADLSSYIMGLYPGAQIIGEESADAITAAGAELADGDMWLIDPLDGTGNFVNGSDDFAVMLVRLKDGETVAAWIYYPTSGRMAVAEKGAGAFLEGEPLQCRPSESDVMDMIGELHVGHLPDDLKKPILAARDRLPDCRPRFCAGVTCLGLAKGERDFALYYRTRPWDHAPGTLVVTEAGGRAARFDGAAYMPGDGGAGLLITADPANWQALRDFLMP